MDGFDSMELGNALAAGARDLVRFWGNYAGGLFLRPGSSMFLGSLALSLILAAWLAVPRGRTRSTRVAVLARALFPRRMIRSASGRADIAWFAFGMLVFGLAFGWAFLSGEAIAVAVGAALTALFGAPATVALPATLSSAIVTVAFFLAYEFSYWFDHWLSHKLPFLWQFHRVHHGAESLSLLTNFRVHPVDTIVFANITALCIGATGGLTGYILGRSAQPFGPGGSNLLLVVCTIALTHLQHSHLWVGFGPRWCRILLGPAHHQIHHSADPVHFNRNFGSSLAVWDRVFGTLHVPAATREPLRFGLGEDEPNPHGFRAAAIDPLLGAARCLATAAPRRRSQAETESSRSCA